MLLEDNSEDLARLCFVGVKIHGDHAALATFTSCESKARPLLIDLVVDALPVQVLEQGQENFVCIFHGEALEDELLAVGIAHDGQKFADTRVLALPRVWLHFFDL